MTTMVAGFQTPSPPKHVQLDQPELAGDNRDNLSVFNCNLMQVLPANGAYPSWANHETPLIGGHDD